MDLEEIENAYKKEIEEAEKEFLAGIKNKKDISEVERDYRNKLKISREKYYRSVSEILKKMPDLKSHKKQDKKEEKIKPLNIRPGNFELSIFHKIRFKIIPVLFRLKLRIKRMIREKTPYRISYNYIKIKIRAKKAFLKTKNSSEQLKEKLRALEQRGINSVKNLAKNIKNKTKKIIGRIISGIQKIKSKKEKGNEKKQAENKKEQTGANSGQNK